MAFDPYSRSDVSRLTDAIDWSRQQMKPFLAKSREVWEQYVGYHYGVNAASDRVPMGLIAMYGDISVRTTVGQTPRVTVDTRVEALEAEAATIEQDVNDWIGNMRLDHYLRMAALNSIMCPFGVLKVALSNRGIIQYDGQELPVTQPELGIVLFEHLIIDMAAESPFEAQYIGNRYRPTVDEAKSREDWDEEVRSELGPRYKNTGTLEDQYNLEDLSGSSGSRSEYKERTEIMDIWLREENLVLTMPADGSGRVLKLVEWDGPENVRENGPYHLLWHKPVPGNVMPLPPALDSKLDTHELANVVFNKLGRMAEIEKVLVGYSGAQKEDVERMLKAPSGTAVLQTDGKAQEMHIGGVPAGTLALLLQLRDIFSWTAGNLDVRGGLSSQAGTLGQEQILAGNAGGLDEEMKTNVIKFTRRIARHLSWYHWTDPLRATTPMKRFEGTDLSAPSEWSPEVRHGRFLDYNYDIDVYSLQYQTPQRRIQQIVQIVQELVVPLLSQLQSEGAAFSVSKLIDMIADDLNLPKMKDVVLFTGQKAGGEVQGLATKPSTSTRNYVRTNQQGDNKAAAGREMMGNLMSMGKSNNPHG